MTSDLFMPIAGKVIEVNPSLEDKPELINEDPYGEGWLLKVKLIQDSKAIDLLESTVYAELI